MMAIQIEKLPRGIHQTKRPSQAKGPLLKKTHRPPGAKVKPAQMF
jgi:hypothetical protein